MRSGCGDSHELYFCQSVVTFIKRNLATVLTHSLNLTYSSGVTAITTFISVKVLWHWTKLNMVQRLR